MLYNNTLCNDLRVYCFSIIKQIYALFVKADRDKQENIIAIL